MSKTVYLEIDNCTKCPYHWTDDLLTADSFEHDIGIFCKKVTVPENETTITYSGRCPYKMVTADDWHPERYALVPDWCPLPTEISPTKE
ncbi:hypothetical protein IJ076_01860 [Candidatus Saccharibacteria bacterium]|nr:hypothetical protein [Candidatus Saccharibacteria bacterium]